jgi:hypothetical protein
MIGLNILFGWRSQGQGRLKGFWLDGRLHLTRRIRLPLLTQPAHGSSELRIRNFKSFRIQALTNLLVVEPGRKVSGNAIEAKPQFRGSRPFHVHACYGRIFAHLPSYSMPVLNQKSSKCCTLLHNASLCCTLLHNASLCCTLLHFVSHCCTLLHLVEDISPPDGRWLKRSRIFISFRLDFLRGRILLFVVALRHCFTHFLTSCTPFLFYQNRKVPFSTAASAARLPTRAVWPGTITSTKTSSLLPRTICALFFGAQNETSPKHRVSTITTANAG